MDIVNRSRIPFANHFPVYSRYLKYPEINFSYAMVRNSLVTLSCNGKAVRVSVISLDDINFPTFRVAASPIGVFDVAARTRFG